MDISPTIADSSQETNGSILNEVMIMLSPQDPLLGGIILGLADFYYDMK